jgi:predicted alpha/beta superfamily hydrolase
MTSERGHIFYNGNVISDQIEVYQLFGSGGGQVKPRTVSVYLPPDYHQDAAERFPVLYMQDGQNLFDPSRSFAGTAWRADETAQELILKKKIQPLLIVAIDNTGDRLDEYTPVRARMRGTEAGGRADEYGRWLTHELKPFIDAQYRTLSQREFTGVGGSSLGGLFALHMGFAQPDVFGRVAAISPSLWWAGGNILREAARLKTRLPLRIWLDTGLREGRYTIAYARRLQDILRSKGWKKNRRAALADFRYLEASRARHDEFSWGARFDKVLKFLYPKM